MVEIIAAIARWVQLAANLTLLGSFVFFVIASTSKQGNVGKWVERFERLFPWLAVSILLGLFIILITTLVQVTGSINNLVHLSVWIDFLENTRVGQVWVLRAIFALLLLLVVLYFRRKLITRNRYVVCATIATLPLIASSLVSHTAAEEFSVIAIMPYALHLIFAGIWFGALPAFLMLLHEISQKEKNKNARNHALDILKRFSSVALPVMLLIIATGLVAGDRIFDDHYAALVATPYGWLFCAKLLALGIILSIAYRVRTYWLPSLIKSEHIVNSNNSGIRKWVRIEFVVALLLLLLATMITHTTPVKYAVIESWPFPFRFSIVATWNEPNVAMQVWTGLALLVLALGIYRLGLSFNWGFKRLHSIPLVLMISGFAVALPPLAIKAHPETYRKPLVPFDAVSIANGATLYAEHCVECHGLQGKGNGIKSRTLSTKLPDMLVEPHIIEHTPGDFYNWITNGMVDTDMPGYAEKISDEGRWDLVNFIHALSRGYQGRILSPEITPNRASAKPPNFSYSGSDGRHGALQDFRDNVTVLLVVFSWPQSQERLEQLKLAYSSLHEQNVMLLAVPFREHTTEELEKLSADLPFVIVTQGASDIASSYALWRRSMSHPDIIGRGSIPEHMEFLIDKRGYLRARWIPTRDTSGWSDIDLLTRQISQLNRESIRMPFPEDYVR